MANFCFALPFFLSFCAFSQAINISSGVVNCNSQCDRTYPLHTYPTLKHNRACQHGCYLALVKIKAWSVLGFHLKNNCSEGCKRQYIDIGSIYACTVGCSIGHGVKPSEKAQIDPSKAAAKPKTQHGTVAAMILRPVMLLHTYGRGMINKLTYYVQSSTSYYFRTNNGGMVVVNIQSEPEVFVQTSNHYQTVQDDEPKRQTKKNLEQNGYTERHESWIVVRRGHHWLHCVSHKSGVPMWILSSILFLSSFFLLWLCCASTATARKNKKPGIEKKAFLIKNSLSISKDKDGQDVALLNLDEDEEQAGPLPAKSGGAVINI